jgi:hypothetical protein
MFLRYHPTLGWDKMPNERVDLWPAETHVVFETNAHGLRGPFRPYRKPAGIKRVLLLGDSFAEGGMVEEGLSVRAQLERRLDGRACGRFEVLNGGTSGWSTDQELLFFREQGRLYAPDAVVLLFFSNDLAGNLSVRKKPRFELVDGRLELTHSPVPPPPPDRVRRPPPAAPQLGPWRGSAALRLLGMRTETGNPPWHRRLAALGLVPPMVDHPPTRSWLLSYGPESEETESRWRTTGALLAALRDETTAIGAPLIIFYVPASFEVDDASWRRTRERWDLDAPGYDRETVIQRLQQVCRRIRVPLVDPRPELRSALRHGESPYFLLDPHWTAVGHRVAAETLAPAIDRAASCGG